MRALIYKDFASAKSTYLLAFGIMLAIAGYSVSHDMTMIIPFLFIYMPMILNTTSFSHEAQSGLPKFIFTTPITRKAYVASKYVIAVFFGALALISGMIIVVLEHMSLEIGLVICAVLFAIPILFSAIQIPFSLKFGDEKGRIIFIATYFLLFATTSYLGDSLIRLINLIQKISQRNACLVAAAIMAITLLFLAASMKIGVVIMKKKEY